MVEYLCTRCNYCGERKLTKPGSTFVEVMLWSIIFLFALPYTLWRHLFGRKKYVCPSCGCDVMVPKKGINDIALGKTDDMPLSRREFDSLPKGLYADQVKKYYQKNDIELEPKGEAVNKVSDIENKNKDEW